MWADTNRFASSGPAEVELEIPHSVPGVRLRHECCSVPEVAESVPGPRGNPEARIAGCREHVERRGDAMVDCCAVRSAAGARASMSPGSSAVLEPSMRSTDYGSDVADPAVISLDTVAYDHGRTTTSPNT